MQHVWENLAVLAEAGDLAALDYLIEVGGEILVEVLTPYLPALCYLHQQCANCPKMHRTFRNMQLAGQARIIE